jgi:membrane protein
MARALRIIEQGHKTVRDSAAPIEPAREGTGSPESPIDIGEAGWKATLSRTTKKIVRDRVSISAGSLAYHWFLALIPALIAILGVLALVRVSPHFVTHVTHAVEKGLPPGVGTVFTAAVKAAATRKSGSLMAVIIGVVVAIWSASGGMSALQQALDIAYEVPVDRKFLARRIHAFPLMAATLVLGGVGAALVILGAPIGAGIEGHVPLHGLAFLVIWTIVRWGVTLITITGLFSFFYFVGPNRESPRWQWVSVGGVFATIVFLAASLGFSFYVTRFGSYGKTYGTFAGVAILIFWLYLTGLAVLIGGELNSELERQAALETRNPRARSSAQRIEQNKPPFRHGRPIAARVHSTLRATHVPLGRRISPYCVDADRQSGRSDLH